VDCHQFSKIRLIDILDACLNKTLGEVDVNCVFKKTETNPKITGIAGIVIEQSILGYPADSRQEPDLIVDEQHVELKTTGIRYTKKKGEHAYKAKEPMSITAVSPDKIVNEVTIDRTLQVFILTCRHKATILPVSNPALGSLLGARPALDWGRR